MGTQFQPFEGYNNSGRGYPDISVAGSSYQVFLGGRQYSISGTSAATPVVAGMISLVNAARASVGRNSLGWINPTLYANHQMFTNDVVEGFTNCTAGSPPLVCCKHGYHSTLGWDPTTGFGSIDFVAFNDFFFRFGEVNLNHPSRNPTSRPTFQTTSNPTRNPSRVPTQAPTQTPLRGSFGNSRPTLIITKEGDGKFSGPKVNFDRKSIDGKNRKSQKDRAKKMGPKGKGFG